jgi:lipopolysaccharide biosynthesis regulator YciM
VPESSKKLSTVWPGFSLLCAVLLFMSDLFATTPSASQLECQRAWQNLVDQQVGNDALLASWRGLEAKCKGTGIYEVRLASILADQDEYDQARQLLQAATIPDNFKKQAEIAEITIDYLQAVATGLRDRQEKLELRAETFLKANPDSTAVRAMLGHTLVVLGKYAQAIAPLENVVRSGRADLGDYRNLVIAYANTGHYEAALELLDKTYSMGEEVTSDEEFVYAATLAYAATGKFESAKTALTLIANKKPQLLNDPKFQQTVLKAKELSHGALK